LGGRRNGILITDRHTGLGEHTVSYPMVTGSHIPDGKEAKA